MTIRLCTLIRGTDVAGRKRGSSRPPSDLSTLVVFLVRRMHVDRLVGEFFAREITYFDAWLRKMLYLLRSVIVMVLTELAGSK